MLILMHLIFDFVEWYPNWSVHISLLIYTQLYRLFKKKHFLTRLINKISFDSDKVISDSDILKRVKRLKQTWLMLK